jgi:hypothetical protein
MLHWILAWVVGVVTTLLGLLLLFILAFVPGVVFWYHHDREFDEVLEDAPPGHCLIYSVLGWAAVALALVGARIGGWIIARW